MNNRPAVWKMVREAVDSLGGNGTNGQIREYILKTYGDVNQGTINAQIIICSVNQPSRIHYPENKKPRICNSPYDFLFSTSRGHVELYKPDVHGVWELREGEFGRLVVARVGEQHEEVDDPSESLEEAVEALQHSFALEAHLRDFLAKNLATIHVDGLSLTLYVDETGRDGIEYPTEVGPIDILAMDQAGSFVVIELKLSRGPDRALGQILRYMGWVKSKLAAGGSVRGIIVASSIDEKLKYAASVTDSISLLEYELQFQVNAVRL